jgi:8-oxo-dGTP diphosphatase
MREAQEETGLVSSDPALLDVVSNVDIDEQGKVKYHYVIIDYLVHVKSLEAKAASDAADLRWVPLDEVEGYNLTSSFRLFFRNNRKKLEQG